MKQFLWTLSEAGTKKGRRVTGGPLILSGVGGVKEFKTVDEQIAILKSRGMSVGPDALVVLLREGYYSVINGYKSPFLDRQAMRSNAGDVYISGMRFDWIYGLFRFDRQLRQITFGYLIEAEAALRTATVYAFCERHRGWSDYLERSSFCTTADMLTKKKFRGNRIALYSTNMNSLMRILHGKLIIKKSTRPFISHYLEAYGQVPLWVLANDLTFGNMSHFFQLMRRSEQNRVCECLFQTTGRGPGERRITPHEILRAYNALSQFRNICAHDERLYCASFGNETYATMLELLAIALPQNKVNHLRDEARVLITNYENRLGPVTGVDLRHRLGM